jgi:hypothetical protein
MLSTSHAKRSYIAKGNNKAKAFKSIEYIELSNDENIVGPGYITPLRR